MVSAVRFERLAERLAARSYRSYPDTVTFNRTTVTKGPSGGNLAAAPAETVPDDIPCRYRPASGSEIQLAGKPISSMAYMLFIPAVYESALIDVDAKCSAVVAARLGGEPSRTFSIQWVGRHEGVEIQLLGTIEA